MNEVTTSRTSVPRVLQRRRKNLDTRIYGGPDAPIDKARLQPSLTRFLRVGLQRARNGAERRSFQFIALAALPGRSCDKLRYSLTTIWVFFFHPTRWPKNTRVFSCSPCVFISLFFLFLFLFFFFLLRKTRCWTDCLASPHDRRGPRWPKPPDIHTQFCFSSAFKMLHVTERSVIQSRDAWWAREERSTTAAAAELVASRWVRASGFTAKICIVFPCAAPHFTRVCVFYWRNFY